MEQKTEASQAVDEPVLPHLPRAVGYRHTMDNTEGLKGNKPVVVFCVTKPNPFGIPGLDYSASFPVTTEALFTADQMKVYARAALKAQPAPIEVPTELKDHNVRQLVNDLRDIAIQFHAAGQLRARISGAVGQFLDTHGLPKGPAEAQPNRHALQAEGKHAAPCARHCEATAFSIEIRRLTAENAQLRAAQGEWQLVPVELTDDMLVAFAEVWYTKVRAIDDCEMADCYAAMLAAAPEAPSRVNLSANVSAMSVQPLCNLVIQGEDSARLDAERYRWVRAADWNEIESIFWSNDVQSGISPEACQAELDAAIDRARASAEAGGVKP